MNISIEIDEQMEARIADALHSGHDFRVDGGLIAFDGVEAELECITFVLAQKPSSELQNHN